ncbi:hypothetical protein Dda_8198 [Drechslerella dactyloides]|uniref:Uncharacterized protein n=1 Tax=Drechslerella dactyloides TaxID=74499 RepID=A0AAD6IRN6_DREDA|nr:hypothetical protein Dda_8198 [Drechslerella dactyloides]
MKSLAFCTVLVGLSQILSVTAAVPWKDSKTRERLDFMRQYRRVNDPDHSNSRTQDNPAEHPHYVDMPLDHFGTDPAAKGQTYKNRYFVQDAYYRPGGPVLFQDIGEDGLDGYTGYITKENLMPVVTARVHGALLILWEHRFYGESAPVNNVSLNIGNATPKELTEFYKHHTIEQALEDVVVFANNFSYTFPNWPADKPQPTLTPDKTPWAFIGCSYSANRGAWLAKRNPGLFKATLASSAPVQEQVNFWQYFRAIEEELAKKYNNCALDLHAAANWMTDAYMTKNTTLVDTLLLAVYGSQWTKLVQYYGVDSPTLWQYRVDYLTNLAWTPYTDFQYVGVEYGILGTVCDTMETAYNPSGSPGGVFASEPLDRAVAAYVKGIVAVTRGTSDVSTTGTINPYLDSLSWSWQYCTEVGGFQVANTARSTNLLPVFVDMQQQIDYCISTYGLSDRVTRNGPDVTHINEKYSGWNIELPNVIWVHGEFDPWRALSIASPDAPEHKATTNIPKCGDTFSVGTQLQWIIRDGHHGSDLAEAIRFNTPLPSVTLTTATKPAPATTSRPKSTVVIDALNAQNLWMSAMGSWIACTTLAWTPTAAPAAAATPRDVVYPGVRYPIARAMVAAAATPAL